VYVEAFELGITPLLAHPHPIRKTALRRGQAEGEAIFYSFRVVSPRVRRPDQGRTLLYIVAEYGAVYDDPPGAYPPDPEPGAAVRAVGRCSLFDAHRIVQVGRIMPLLRAE